MRAFGFGVALVAMTALPVTAQIGNPGGMTAGTPVSEPGTPAPHQPNADDRLFYYLAGTGGMAEVEAGRAAEKRASSAAVKDFARRMAEHHAKANRTLQSLAKAANVTLPESVDADHRAQRAELDRLNGKAFDLAYMQQQLVEHQKTATLLQWQISTGQDGDLQRFAMQTLPGIFEHLEMAQTIIAALTGAAPQGLAATSASPPAGRAEAGKSRYGAWR